MPRQYDEDANFNNRFKVETNYGGEIIDHHEEFSKREYAQSQNKVYQPPEGSGLPTVKRGQRTTVKPPKPAKPPVIKAKKKTTTDDQDAALKNAAKQDLSNRGL